MALINPIQDSFGRQGIKSMVSVSSMRTVTSMNSYRAMTPDISKIAQDEIINIPLNDSIDDARQILSALSQMAVQFARLPAIREATVNLLSCLKDNDINKQIKQLIYFVKDVVRYVPDPRGSEYIISPVRMLRMIDANGKVDGDCDDHVLLFCSMAGSIGLRTRVVGVKLNRQDIYDHVIAQVMNDSGTWWDVDLCAKMHPQPNYQDKLISV